ncbi:MAG: RNA polymerase sigma factor [Candidatus Aphodocola sp.]
MNRPKRRKKKDNPYRLSYINEEDKYVVLFKDGKGILQSVSVNKNVFNEMDKFELDDLSELNEFDNHIEHSEVYDNNIYTRSINKPESLEDYIIRKSTYEDLNNAISKLPITQQRRIKMYYFYGYTQKKIAKIEGTSIRAVQYSLNIAIINLKKNLKKL